MVMASGVARELTTCILHPLEREGQQDTRVQIPTWHYSIHQGAHQELDCQGRGQDTAAVSGSYDGDGCRLIDSGCGAGLGCTVPWLPVVLFMAKCIAL